ncbi:MAG: acetylglutamate kinase [Alphaproteobacteria bacterium]|nr:acetylglutamate kinase [Alphaproteobacteria bacterium]
MKDKAKRQKDWLEKAGILTDALPFMRRYAGKTIVVKYGGHAMGDDALAREFAHDVTLLKQVGIDPVVVHGGGPQIGRMLERLSIKSEFVDGLRVTDAATMEVAEMVLSGLLNKGIVAGINAAGARAVGLSGKDANLIRPRKLRRSRRDPDSNIEKIVDLGFVGEPAEVDPHVLDALKDSGFVPVVAPIAADGNGQTYNINADTAAGAIAGAMDAERLLLLTDVEGVLDKSGALIHEMTVAEAKTYMADGTLTGGMIPKVETCLRAIGEGVKAAVILDGRVPHSMLLEMFTPDGSGTLIRGE